MGRLFWKIFLCFWLTMILVTLGVAWLMSAVLDDINQDRRSRMLARISAPQMLAVARVLEYNGESVAKALLSELASTEQVKLFVIDKNGEELLGRPVKAVLARPQATFHSRQVVSMEGNEYLVMAVPQNMRARTRPPWIMPKFIPPSYRYSWFIPLRLGFSILVSGLVCCWLAWYLSRPVKQLRRASAELAKGRMDVRVGGSIRQRDEIADLGRDFDRMAAQLQSLMSGQKQLFNNISHELRSPLARLHVAIGLARKKSDPSMEKEIDRLERDITRLDVLVSQVLTLARLETGEPPVLEDYVDIVALLEEVVEDVEFEVVDKRFHIKLACNTSQRILKADVELLRRALENIIRNAVRYTKEDTTVLITLREVSRRREVWLELSVCDSGPGVPDAQIETLFEPFFRVAQSRDRDTGGYGLGLAIAKQAIFAHGGTIAAHNRAPGLCIVIQLPAKPL